MKHLFLFLVMVVSCAACPVGWNVADLNNDCRVDLADFAILAENWLKEFEMSYPNEVQVSGTLSVGPGGDRQLVPIVPAVIVQDGEENGRPTWGVTASGWAIKIRWIGEGPSSYWRMEITRPDAVIGIWSSEGYGGAEELIGLYVQVSRAAGTATVTEYISETVVELTPSHPIEINSIVCTDAFIIENSLTGVDNSIF